MEPGDSNILRRRGPNLSRLKLSNGDSKILKTVDGAVDDEEEGPSITDHGPVQFREYLSALKWWDEEYRYALLCIIFAILLAMLLRRYDNELEPELPFGLNLDMVVVAMMTGVRVGLKAITEASISQGAWIWVSANYQRRLGNRHARLEDFKRFDEASRGL